MSVLLLLSFKRIFLQYRLILSFAVRKCLASFRHRLRQAMDVFYGLRYYFRTDHACIDNFAFRVRINSPRAAQITFRHHFHTVFDSFSFSGLHKGDIYDIAWLLTGGNIAPIHR